MPKVPSGQRTLNLNECSRTFEKWCIRNGFSDQTERCPQVLQLVQDLSAFVMTQKKLKEFCVNEEKLS